MNNLAPIKNCSGGCKVVEIGCPGTISVDTDQTAPIGAVCSGSTLFVLYLIRQ